jgi:hypothetical protein
MNDTKEDNSKDEPTRVTSAEIESLDKTIGQEKEIQKILLEETMPLETIYKWDAPERVFEKRDRRWYVIVASVAMGAIVLSALTNNFVLIFAIIALVLVLYTLNTIPPHIINHEITNKGVHSFDNLYTWKNIQSFWVVKRGKEFVINLEVKLNSETSHRRMIILVGSGDLQKIVAYLVRHIDYLSPNEVGINPFNRFIEGEYLPLLKIVNDKNLQTKDPKDASPEVVTPEPITVK